MFRRCKQEAPGIGIEKGKTEDKNTRCRPDSEGYTTPEELILELNRSLKHRNQLKNALFCSTPLKKPKKQPIQFIQFPTQIRRDKEAPILSM